MEISPNELCNMICAPAETSNDEVIELVDTYLCTTIDLLIEAIHKRIRTCADKSNKHVFCNRLMVSIVDQMKPFIETNMLTPQSKKWLLEMEDKIKTKSH